MASQWCKEDFINKGGYGVINRYRNKVTGECLAVKSVIELPSDGDDGKAERQKLSWKNECEMMLELSHPNIIKAFEVPSEVVELAASEFPLLAMEYCSKGDLRRVLNKPQNSCGLPELEVRMVVHDIASAIEYIHNKGIVHRDIKPENILVAESQDSQVVYKLADLGFAKDLSTCSACVTKLGTMFYLAPEICLQKPYNNKADYWSFGTLVFECITGNRPFFHTIKDPNHWCQAFVQVRNKKSLHIYGSLDARNQPQFSENIPSSNQLNRTLKGYLEQWLRMMLEWEPEKRGGPVDSKTNRLKCFTLLEKIINVEFVNIFCPAINEKFSYPVCTSSSSMSPSVALREILMLIPPNKRIPADSMELLTADGRPVDLHQPVTNYIDSYKNHKEAILYLYDKRHFSMPGLVPLPLNGEKIQTVETSASTVHHVICLLAYKTYEHLCNMVRLDGAQQAAQASLMCQNAQLSDLKNTLMAKYNYFKNRLSFCVSSLDVDNEEFRNYQSISMLATGTNSSWNFTEEFSTLCQSVANDVETSQLSCRQVDANVVELQKAVIASSAQLSKLRQLQTNAVQLHEDWMKLLKEHAASDCLKNDRLKVCMKEYQPKVGQCISDFRGTEAAVSKKLYTNISTILTCKRETDACASLVNNTIRQVEQATVCLYNFQQQHQHDVWQLLSEKATELQALNRCPDKNWEDEGTDRSSQPEGGDSSDLVNQTLQTKARLDELVRKLTTEEHVKWMTTMDWSFLDIASS